MAGLIDRVRTLYLRRRSPVAFILVATITLAGVIGSAPLELVAGIALLSLILQVLLEMDEKLSGRRAQTWYPTFQESLPGIAEEIEKRLRHGRLVRMRWIGVTQEAGWPFSQNLMLRVLDGKLGNVSLRVELALIDPDGQICERPDGPDKDQIRSTIEKISRFARANGNNLANRHSSITAYTYDYRPTWHALLVDEDILFYSTCIPQNLSFASPQGGGEVIRLDDGEPATERIRHFIAWFSTIESEARNAGKFVGPTV